MANNLTLNLTTLGIEAYNQFIANGIPLVVTKVELSQNTVQPPNPNTWLPDGGTGMPYYIQTNNVSSFKALPNNILSVNMDLNQSIPQAVTYNGTTYIDGWVGGTTATEVNIGSFAIFIKNPISLLVVPFIIGFFNGGTIDKYSTTDVVIGNNFNVLNNLELTANSTDQIIYQLNQVVNAQVSYFNNVANLPIPNTKTSNVYEVVDIQSMATTDYKTWNFTNYNLAVSGAIIDSIDGTQFTSIGLANALSSSLTIVGQSYSPYNLLIGEIVNSNGVMKQCFLITSYTSTNVFDTNAILNSLSNGDTLRVFILDSVDSLNDYQLNNVAGMISYFAMATPPKGYLWCDGSILPISFYPRLAQAIGNKYGGDGVTTFGLPDLRGIWIRGYGTNSRGDTSVALGVYQMGAYQNHAHTAYLFGGIGGGGHEHYYTGPNGSAKIWSGAAAGGFGQLTTYGGGAHSHTMDGAGVAVNNSTTGATENRVSNIPMLACIKY